jgi:hypothetical protein
MKPTPKLRWIEREVSTPHPKYTNVSETKTVCIIQQWWEDKNIMLAVHITDKDGNTLPSPNRGEWRDVSIEKE